MRNRSVKLTKKLAAIILTAAMTCGMLAGCSGTTSTNDVEEKTPVVVEQADTSEGSGSVEKSETVYVTADANGNVASITVSDWLKNKANYTTITDTTTLDDVVAIKGSNDFSQTGDDLEFTANGNDVYYRGSLPADTQLPVSLNITYTLDGKEIAGDELEGATGHLEMNIKYTNHSSYTATIDGKEKDIHVPFLATTLMMVSSDKASNMEITNGKILENGDTNMIVGYGFPGVNESFGLDDGGVFTDTVTFSADVTDYSTDMMMTFVTSEVFASSDLDKAVDVETVTESLQEVADISIDDLNDIHSLEDIESVVDNMKDKFKELGDGATKLNDGANELKDGAKDLNTGANDLKNGSNDLKNGAKDLMNGAASLKKGATDLKDGIATFDSKLLLLNDGMVSAKDGGATLKAKMSEAATASTTLAAGAKQVSDGVSTLNTALTATYDSIVATMNENQAKMGQLKQALAAVTPGSEEYMTYYTQLNQLGGANEALKTMKDKMDQMKLKENLAALNAGAKQVSDGSLTLSNGLGQLSAGADSLYQGLNDLASGCKQLSAASKLLVNGSSSLASGSSKLYNGTVTLSDGTIQLADGTVKLVDGTEKFVDGTAKLADGTKELHDGTAKLTDAFNGNLTPLLDTTKALKDAAIAFNTFTALPTDAEGHVAFVIRTE